MALFRTFTINLHCPDLSEEQANEQYDLISEILDRIPLADILKHICEQKVSENEETKTMTVTVCEE